MAVIHKSAKSIVNFNRDEYQALLDALPDSLLLFPLSRRGFKEFIEVNQRACEFYGYSHEEFLQLSFLDLIVPTDRQKKLLIQAQKQLLKQDHAVIEAKHKSKDRRILNVEVHFRILNSSHHPLVVATCKDISERLKTQEIFNRAKESAERYLNISAEIILALDTSGNITLLNESAHKLLGYSRNELIGKNWFQTCLPQASRESFHLKFKKLMRGDLKPPAVRKCPVLTKTGKEKVVLWHHSILKNEKGETIGMLSSGSDITQLTKTEKALKASEARYRFLFENSPIALWEEDLTDMIEYLHLLKQTHAKNQDLDKYLDQHPEEVQNLLDKIHILNINKATVKLHKAKNKKQVIENLSKFFTDDFYRIFKDELQAIASGQNNFSCEERIRTLDGEIKSVQLKLSLLPPQTNTMSKYLGLIATMDITEMKKAERANKRAQRSLEILHELDKAILEAESMDDILNAALDNLKEIIPADRLSTLIFTEDKKTGTVFARGLLENKIGQGEKIPINQSLPKYQELRDGKISKITIENEIPETKEISRTMLKAGLKEIYNIPIMVHKELLGTLNIASKQKNQFSGMDLKMAREVANIIALAIEQARLHEAIKQHALAVNDKLNELQKIYELSLGLSGVQAVNELAQKTTEIISQATDSDLAVFFLVENKKLILTSSFGKTSNKWSAPKTLNIGECLCGLAGETGEIVFSFDTFQDPHCTRSECKDAGIRSYAAIPLIINDKVQSIIGLGSQQKRDFSIQKSYLETLANETTLGLQNAILWEELKGYEAELEARIAQRTAELKEANQELESFSYSVSHDLRAPLRAIDGFSQILEEDYGHKLDKEAHRLIGVIRKNTQRMAQLIDDLLSFSRSGRQAIKRSKINMTDMAKAIYFELTDEKKRENTVFKIRDLPPALADPNLLRQVWQNLISNALKFSQKQKIARIEIGSFEQPNTNVYFIKDNGVGFDMKYAHKLFQIFQRLHSDEEFEGTGVGLSIVQRILKRHNGRIWAQAKVNEGATFYFSLPKIE